MPKEDNKILKYNHLEKSMKVPFIIYADLEPLLEKINTNWNSPEKSSTTKINIHLLVIHCLVIVHVMLQETHLIIIEENIIWKDFVRI